MRSLPRRLAALLTITTSIAVPSATAFALSNSQSFEKPKSQNLVFLSSHSLFPSNKLNLLRNSSSVPHMDAHVTTLNDSTSYQTEFMVDMSCEGCVQAVKNKLQTVEGIKKVDVDLGNQVVRILGTTSVKTMTEALEQTGKKARLIGQGLPEAFFISAAVAEFKGPDIFGVVRFAQVNLELARIEANFSGLSPGKHGWSINEYGDLTRGAESTGNIYNPASQGLDGKPMGDLGTLDANEKGEAIFSGVKQKLRVADLIGRSIAVYETEDRSDSGLKAAVIARSAGVGENYKKICTCDGTTIWEAGDKDLVGSKM